MSGAPNRLKLNGILLNTVNCSRFEGKYGSQSTLVRGEPNAAGQERKIC